MDNKKFTDLKKMIKEENTLGQRLQSLRLPRDLSLGGPKIVKKQFIPNLKVVRNKDKVKEVSKKFDNLRNVRNMKQNRHENSNQRYIQSSGVFSDGIGTDGKKLYRNGYRGGNTKENDVAPHMTVPTIKKNSWEFNKKNEENVLDEIMADDEEIDQEKLPFQIISWNEKEFKDIPKIKTEANCDKIKLEYNGEAVPEIPLNKVKVESPELSIKEYLSKNEYSDHNPALTLWRLPDSFAGNSISEDPNCKKLVDYSLHDMPEGQIGKLILRKSGKVEILIGKMKHTLEPTESGVCREEILAFDVKETKESSATIIGQIQNRFLLNPDWNTIFQ